jgi:hypothetical protein
MLRNNVGIFTERGGTIGFLLSKDGIVVIDSQFPDTSAHLIRRIKKAANFALPLFAEYPPPRRSLGRKYCF